MSELQQQQHISPTASATTPLSPSEVDFMPALLRSLSTLMLLKGKHVSPQFLLAGLAGSEKVSVGACLRAAERAGLKGKVMYRPKLDGISPLTMPCILLLKDNTSCVLTSIDGDKAQVILAEFGDSSQTLSLDELKEQYSGYAVFGALETRADARTEPVKLKAGKDWFWSVLRFYMPIYRHVALASVVVNTIAVASSLFVMNVYDRVIPNNAYETLWVLAAGVTLAYLFDFLLRSLRSHFVDLAGRNADVVLSSRLVDKVLSMRMDSKPESTGALVNNLREFESLREFFSSTTFLACIDIPFLILFFLLLAFIGGPLVLLPLGAMPVLLGAGIYLQMAARKSAEKSYRHSMQKNALLVEMVNGLETVKGCMAESRMQRLWEAVSGISAQSSNEARKYSTRAVSFATFITQMVTVGMVIWGVYRIGSGEMSMGGLIGCNILVGRIMAPLLQLASLLTRLQNSRVSLKALNTLMELPSENQDQAACMDFGSLSCDFVMDGVSFAYPGAQALALDGVSLRIRPGEKVGIIGKMGSGKSTLGKLLIGLYQPKEGQVTFGGVDIAQLATADLRSRTGFLPQEVVLFYGSVRDNIALGDPTINDHLILRASAISGVADFVRKHPSGYGAQVGEQGRNLSGGQRQAIGLARALVRDPDVLILDEPTSNMDVESEHLVQQRLAAATKDKTLILITHRLSMLRMVDRLIVMNEGKIVLDGPKEAVLQKLQEGQRARSAQSAPLKAAQDAVAKVVQGAQASVRKAASAASGKKEGPAPAVHGA
ncbi:type I secretion system permease/ATPase [uncultured Mailhella sp.]|uniref:type I secretion system permease/ATPase n=1 Tax=uncultured Mailhella sp. TaxID=1981031 RepID=UPI0026395275|nr:type I secretion system permease/ATPase [uncultured Mailhella sp.]